MKSIIFVLLCAPILLLAQAQKITAPTIAVVSLAKTETDKAAAPFCDKPMHVVLSINLKDTVLAPLDTLDGNYAYLKEGRARELRAKSIKDRLLKKKIPDFLVGSIAILIQEWSFGIEGRKVLYIDTTLSTDLAAQRQFARKNKVRYVLNPQKFTANKQGETANITLNLVFYDSLTHTNSLIESIKGSDRHKNVFALKGIRTGDCEPRNHFAEDFFCHIERVLSIAADTVLYKMMYNDETIRNKINLQSAKIAKMDSLFKTKPDPRIIETVMLFVENAYKKEKIRYQDFEDDSTEILHYTAKDCYNTLFNADKTKFIAFFATKRQIKNTTNDNGSPLKAPKMEDAITHGIYNGLFEKGKWYIAKNENSIMNQLGSDLATLQKIELNRGTSGFLQDTSLALNPVFWQKNKFRDMQDKIAALDLEIKAEIQRDELQIKRNTPDYIQKDIEKLSEELKNMPHKEIRKMLKESIKNQKERLKAMKKNPEMEERFSRVESVTNEQNFYKNEYPVGYELVVNYKIDSLKTDMQIWRDTLEARETEPFLDSIALKRPDLCKTSDEWENEKGREAIYSADRKYYIFTRIKSKNEAKIAKNEHLFIYKYFFFDIQNKKWYEWTYNQSHPIAYTSKFYEHKKIFKILAKWTPAYPTLDDPAFWSNYVLKQEKGAYIYLKPIF